MFNNFRLCVISSVVKLGEGALNVFIVMQYAVWANIRMSPLSL